MSSSGKDAGRDSVLAELTALHEEIDRRARTLAQTHAARLRCRLGCTACCQDDLTVSTIEAERIRRAHPDLLAAGAPHPRGACAFLDERGACRIYAERPSVCRSQGLPLRVLFENEEEEIEEHRDICPLNLPDGPPLEALAEDDCWLLGPEELRIGQLDDAFSPGEGPRERIALRSLFAPTPPTSGRVKTRTPAAPSDPAGCRGEHM